jgi:hypothetical protein
MARRWSTESTPKAPGKEARIRHFLSCAHCERGSTQAAQKLRQARNRLETSATASAHASAGIGMCPHARQTCRSRQADTKTPGQARRRSRGGTSQSALGLVDAGAVLVNLAFGAMHDGVVGLLGRCAGRSRGSCRRSCGKGCRAGKTEGKGCDGATNVHGFFRGRLSFQTPVLHR